MKGYTEAIEKTLESVLCLRNFPSELVEKHNKPEIEMYDHDKSNKCVVLKPIMIARSKRERCLIEASVNSVRISLKIK